MTPVVATKKDVPSPDEFISRCEQEHGILKSLYTDLLTAYNARYRVKIVEKILHIMTMYVKFHFGNEEQFMSAYGYQNAKSHTDIHQEFISQLKSLVTAFRRGDDVYDPLRKMYYDLSTGHIPETDEELLRFARTLPKIAEHPAPGAALRWGNSYLTGVQLIDHEHEVLFTLYKNALAACARGDADLRPVAKALASLESMMRIHFQNEEELMEETGYSEAKPHTRQHEHYLAQFEKMRVTAESGQPVRDDMLAVFKNWVGCHLMISDKDFGAYLLEAQCGHDPAARSLQ